ncbi:MAG TPA: class F sortase [Intrasporangium sp.]|nr:class F sortase [Intrasporangium sp.]
MFQPLGQAPAASVTITAPTTPEPASTAGSTPASRARTATPAPTASAAPTRRTGPTSQPTVHESSCRPGVPARLVIPALGVNAPFERIGLDQNAPADANGNRPLGNPVDRRHAGWFSSGPQPGSGRGTVLINGHTYRNGSAIFKEDFATRAQAGQRIDIVQANGSTCSYRIERIWRTVDSAHDYPKIVSREGLYDATGPERLFLATCGGRWSDRIQNYLDINIVIATPVDR